MRKDYYLVDYARFYSIPYPSELEYVAKMGVKDEAPRGTKRKLKSLRTRIYRCLMSYRYRRTIKEAKLLRDERVNNYVKLNKGEIKNEYRTY
jgi:hypothetical protein